MFMDILIPLLASATALVSWMGVSRFLLKKRLSGLVGHERIVHLSTTIVILSIVTYLSNLWGIVSILFGSIAAAGSIALIVGFSMVPWLTDAVVGLSLYVDPYIKVGAYIEIDGKTGRIIEMNLTRTKISGNECLYIVPNRKFRENIVTLKSPLEDNVEKLEIKEKKQEVILN